MARITLNGFMGLRPRTNESLLQDNEAQIADNCNLSSGAIDAWRNPSQNDTLAISGTVKTVFWYEGDKWLQWNEDVDVVRSVIADDTTDRVYFTGTDAPRVTDNTMVDIGGSGIYPESSYLLGVPAPTTAPSLYVNGTSTGSDADRAYVYTFVNSWGEESEPSPVSTIVLVGDSQTVDLSSMDAAPTGNYVPITKWRIYRIASGTTGAEYLFVDEVTINASSPQYNDSILTANLGEAIQTIGWALPPTSLVGLTRMGNGILAGFSGKDIYFSEPFVPYAWPDAYRLTSEYTIIGLGSFGNSLVVLTDSFPYVITGSYPSQMSMDDIKFNQPCVAKRGIVSTEGGVMWPSPTGLFYYGMQGAYLKTDKFYTKDEWNKLDPSSIFSAYYDNQYIGYLPSLQKAIVFAENDNLLTTYDSIMDTIYSYPDGDRLFYVNNVNAVNTVFEFNVGGTKATYQYKSKKFQLGSRLAMTSARIYADYSAILTDAELAALQAEQTAIIAANVSLLIDTGGSIDSYAINEMVINGDNLSTVPPTPQQSAFVFRLYGDSVLIFDKQIYNNKPFRVSTGNKKYINYEIEVFGSYPIEMIRVATSVEELMSG